MKRNNLEFLYNKTSWAVAALVSTNLIASERFHHAMQITVTVSEIFTGADLIEKLHLSIQTI